MDKITIKLNDGPGETLTSDKLRSMLDNLYERIGKNEPEFREIARIKGEHDDADPNIDIILKCWSHVVAGDKAITEPEKYNLLMLIQVYQAGLLEIAKFHWDTYEGKRKQEGIIDKIKASFARLMR